MVKGIFKEKNLFLFFCLLWIASLVFSPFLLTMAMIGIFIMGIVGLVKKIRAKETSYIQWIKQFATDPLALFVIFFLITLLNWFYSFDQVYWLERLRLRMLFLFLPFSFYALPKFSKKDIQIILYFLMFLMVVTNIWIGIQYFIHFDAYQNLISKGKSIPTPRNHIRFNLLLAISIISGIYLWIKSEVLKYNWERNLVKITTIFLFIFIHILAVRSGLVALYFALFILLISYIVQRRNYLYGIIGLIGLFLIPVIAIKTIPSIKSKLDYTMWDNHSSQEGNIKEHSDGERITSQRIGLEIFKDNPIFGVGSGDLRNEVKMKYLSKFGDEIEPKMPHNQFISILAKNGILGFIAFMFAMLFPLFYKKNYRNIFILGFFIIMLTSFLVENTIENAIGAGIYMFFVIMILRQEKAAL